VGKTPIYKALAKFHPELHARLRKLVLYNSRNPRPGELDGIDYHFRTRIQIESLRSEGRYVLIEVRSDLQALDVEELESLLQRGDVLFEGSPHVGRQLMTHPKLAATRRLTVFVSPLAKEEIEYLKAPERNVLLPEFVTDVMRRKLLRRTRRQKQELSLKDLEDIERRAGSAYGEMQEAWRFQHVIVNHDGEDSDNWDAFYYLIGDARKTVAAFAALLNGEEAVAVEQWVQGLLPDSGK
jgi:guanylate kinase